MDRRDFLKKGTALALAPIALPGLVRAAQVQPLTPIETPEFTLFPTGIRPLDEALGGGIPAGLCLMSGHCGSGKTALLRRIHKAGLSRHVEVHVENDRKPVICPLTGMAHYKPKRLCHDWLDRPVALIDDIQDIAQYSINLRSRLFYEYFSTTFRRNIYDSRLAVIAWRTNRPAEDSANRGIVVGRPHFANFYSRVIIRVHQLDIRGRGRIEIIKNRQTGFLGHLTI